MHHQLMNGSSLGLTALGRSTESGYVPKQLLSLFPLIMIIIIIIIVIIILMTIIVIIIIVMMIT